MIIIIVKNKAIYSYLALNLFSTFLPRLILILSSPDIAYWKIIIPSDFAFCELIIKQIKNHSKVYIR